MLVELFELVIELLPSRISSKHFFYAFGIVVLIIAIGLTAMWAALGATVSAEISPLWHLAWWLIIVIMAVLAVGSLSLARKTND